MGTSSSSFKIAYKQQVTPVGQVTSFADLQAQVNLNFKAKLHLGIHQIRFLYKPLNFEICSDRDLATVLRSAEMTGQEDCIITLERVRSHSTKGSFVVLDDQSLYPVVKLKSGIEVLACGLINRAKSTVVLPSKAVRSLNGINKCYLAINTTRLPLYSPDFTFEVTHGVVLVKVDPDLIPMDVPQLSGFSNSCKKATMCIAVQADSQHYLNLEVVSVAPTTFTVQGDPMMLGALIYDLDWHLLGVAVETNLGLRMDAVYSLM